MTRATLAIIALLLGACATGPAPDIVKVKWVKVDNIDKQCGIHNNGCFDMRADVCHVYTRAPKSPYDTDTHRTLGHEVRHCFEGFFHPPEQRRSLKGIGQ